MGKWLFRGPLKQHEINAFLRIPKAVAQKKGDFKEAASFILEAMLQSPRFIYRLENQRGNGKPRPVNNHELASRLSYIIWGAPPDQQLINAADNNQLTNRATLAKHADRMLKDPRAIQKSEQFISEWLNLDRLNYLRPNKKHFPKFDPRLAADMRNETIAFFKEVAWTQNRPLAHLFNAQFTFATPALAKHYGFKPKGKGVTRYDLSKTPARGGILTQGAVLTIGGDEASMVTRGLFVLKDVLRGSIKDPPPCVNTVPKPAKPGLSLRGVAQQRIDNPNCGGCHVKFEPLAFGLERFNGLGAYHEKDHHGNKLRHDGHVIFPNTKKLVKYNSSAQLMNILANSDHAKQGITWKIAQFALGRPITDSDTKILNQIHLASQKAGGTYSAVIKAIVTSDLVLLTETEKQK